MDDGKKYSETVVRHTAQDVDGGSHELLERLTFEREQRPDGTWTEPLQINQRFDLKTGQRVNHLGGDEFQVDVSGELLTRKA